MAIDDGVRGVMDRTEKLKKTDVGQINLLWTEQFPDLGVFYFR